MKKTISCIVFCAVLSFSDVAASNSSSESRTAFFCDELRNLVSFINNTDCRAGAWLPNCSLSSIFNGQNGSAIIYNYGNDSGVYIPARSLNCTWDSTRDPWTNYFRNLNLTQLFELGRMNGTIFTMANITEEILIEIVNALTSWSPRSIQQNPLQDPFNAYRNISYSFSDLFDGPLLGFLSTMGTIPLSYDIFWLTEVLRGLSSFFNNLPGFVNKRFTFDARPVLSARNDTEALASLLQALDPSFNINDLLNTCSNFIRDFLQFVSRLGGIVCNSVTGRLTATIGPVAFGNQVCQNSTLGSVLDNPVRLLESAESLYNATQNLGPQFAGLGSFVDSLRRINGTNGTSPLQIQ